MVIGSDFMDIISDRTDVLKILPEAAEELCSALFRNSPAGIYITRNGKFIYTNIEFRRITGYTQDELSGKDYLRLINPRYRQMPKQNVASLWEEDDTSAHEFKITTKEGKKKWISEKITYLKYGGNWLTMGHWLDISEHHAVEKAWREAERRFQAAFEDLSMGMSIISIDGIFLKANKSFFDMIGYDEKEVLESRFEDILHPEDHRTAGDLMQLFLSLEKPEEPIHKRLICKDGRTVWVALVISLIGDSEGAPSYFIVHFSDITEQKRIEEGLKEEERLYRSLVDSSLEPIAVADLDCHLTHVSLKLLSLLGYAGSSELLGKKIDSLVASPERDRVEPWILDCMKQGTPGNLGCGVVKKDGSLLPTALNVSWVSNDKGAPMCIVIGLKETAAAAGPPTAVRDAQSSQSIALENTATPIALVNEDTTIALVNAAFEKLAGYPREEIEGKKSWVEFVAKEDLNRLKRYHLLRRLDPGAAPDTYEFKFAAKSGDIKDVRITISLVPGTGKTVATLTDLTETNHEKVAQSLVQLEKTINGTIEAFAKIVEMRDPHTSGHQERVSTLASAIAVEMGLPEDQVKGIVMAGKTYDIGKAYIPAELLSKPGRLNALEYQIIQAHAQGSYDILRSIDFPWPVAEIAFQHQERLDGSGYPRGLIGKDIMLEAKILMVADVVEAMSAHRPFRPSLGIDAALEEISKNSGVLYDADVVTACIKLFREKGFSFKKLEDGS
ncbi:MAG: PAS domain S-box protein [Chloroflexi bacterium]|nr:PAS domain S-box protein [Chloroflexota bacterium]